MTWVLYKKGGFMNIKSAVLFLAIFSLFISFSAGSQADEVTISGKVYDASDDNPIHRAMVILTASGFSGSDMADADGRYSIDDCPTDKELKLTCRKAGYRPYTATLPILTEVTSYTAYTYDIPLSGIIKGGGIGYDEDYEKDLIYYKVKDGEKLKEGEYAPGVEPDKLKNDDPNTAQGDNKAVSRDSEVKNEE